MWKMTGEIAASTGTVSFGKRRRVQSVSCSLCWLHLRRRREKSRLAPRKETTETERAQMKILRDEGYSFRHIANRMNLSPSTVYKCVRRHDHNGNFKNTPGRGRKKKLTTTDEKYLKVTSLRNRRKSSKELTRDLEETTGKKVYPRLVRTWPEMWDSHIIIHLFQGAFWIDYRSIWCRDSTIICITKKLEGKMPAYTSSISDVHKSYGVEKIVLHRLIFLLIKISKC